MSVKSYKSLVIILAGFHIFIIACSNYLVQFPIEVIGFKATWGAFTFPFIFIATDLTVRLLGANEGRVVVLYAMLPALVISYVITTLFKSGEWLGINRLQTFDLFVFRIALASFSAYIIGQLIDIFVFNTLRRLQRWWYAPLASAIFGNLADTFTFFFVAFYKTSDTYLAENFVEIAWVDYVFKILINSIIFLPVYKLLLDQITRRFKKNHVDEND
ncbi:MAG TPA: 7-cyano-7-deazaguanine/7-aminomethyl-7-deazaguanine transporter [Niabella sp.]|jgi:uncharacterized integral membrane protein (TIGR00697 family)|nr:7-cyano-7-deazaguanine/7-aminomethyl-7-deazaguanine transporter [Chitinophagaceae bacterium]HRN46725.1 7-cyano-7-deazaguanine/7-aminomethyl-7-deazaguanine transporter [Niabella sp.]HRO83506.1 7-cyano-7-deazaguanine/7-aminomethyl-7-deazaguanine transporter [Niabella sp.]HUN02414.1 7-cyano-7-deazaguanine/7-aminomethyl-7-deazaguanine transporter [Niabella sp.]